MAKAKKEQYRRDRILLSMRLYSESAAVFLNSALRGEFTNGITFEFDGMKIKLF